MPTTQHFADVNGKRIATLRQERRPYRVATRQSTSPTFGANIPELERMWASHCPRSDRSGRLRKITRQ
ncbi:MAG: hypothetical protein CM15mP103_02090 [Gammaproteobacteria bacterium]|nr:MAG: hypothetical protein CM15mP103_02090 [Gammaproteobacteria bacterium]